MLVREGNRRERTARCVESGWWRQQGRGRGEESNRGLRGFFTFQEDQIGPLAHSADFPLVWIPANTRMVRGRQRE